MNANEEELEILKFLYNQNNDVTLDEICRNCDMEKQKATYHLKKLDEKEYVHKHTYMGPAPETYELTKDGRTFLIEKKLV